MAARLDRLRQELGSGNGGEVFTQFLAIRRQFDSLRRQTWQLAAGPIAAAAAGVAALALGMALVVPELKLISESAGLRLGPASNLAFAAAEQGRGYWLAFSILVLLAGHIPWVTRSRTERWLAGTVLMGPAWRAIDDAEWSQTTALLLSNGASLPRAMLLANEFVVPAAADTPISTRWERKLQRGNNAVSQLAILRQAASRSAARAGVLVAWWSAAIWPATGLALLLMAIALGGFVCQPVLAYLRSWA